MSKVLIVDDNPKNIQVVGNILANYDHIIEYAQDGNEAVDIVKSEPFDLILMDVMMPGMDGYTACMEIKKLESRADIPIIFLTAKTDADSVTNGFESGGVDYVTKPFNATELLARVNTHLALKNSKDKLQEMNGVLEEKVQERTVELRKAMDELEVLDSAKNEFLRIISHEIRTPLNVILGFARLIKNKYEIVQNIDMEILNALESSCKRLENFSMTGLNISSLLSKGLPENSMEKINVGEVIGDVLFSLEEQIDAKKLIVINKTNNDTLNAHKKHFGDCIHIILENAVKHCANKGEIKVSTQKKANHLTITVKDSGKGFPDTFINQGIKAFVSMDHIDRNPGIDLYLCKVIMESHNGTISLDNDKGAIVQLGIPLA